MLKDKIIYKNNQNLLDFVLTYKGNIEDNLFPFLLEQNYNSYHNFNNTSDKYIKTSFQFTNLTEFYSLNNIIVATKTTDEISDASYDISFDLSFES